MSRIDEIFTTIRRESRAALMPFITAGYPSLAATERTILAMDEAGASIVEIGIPFSDPIADGPVIAQAMHEALEAGVTPRSALGVAGSVRSKTNLGLIAMVSESIVMRVGAERFLDDCSAAGIDGLIVPDIDVARAEPVASLAQQRDMSLSMLIAPTSSPKRIGSIVSLCSGFVYLLARAGITGERDAPPDVSERIKTIRNATDLPIAVGFGISKPEHVAAVIASGADAAIVGSAIVRAMGEAVKRCGDPAEAAAALVRDLAGGMQKSEHAALAPSPRPHR